MEENPIFFSKREKRYGGWEFYGTLEKENIILKGSLAQFKLT